MALRLLKSSGGSDQPGETESDAGRAIEAFRDHGRVRTSLTENVDQAERQILALAGFGIDFDAVTAELQREGVEKFVQPFDQLLETLERKRQSLAAGAGA